jgi:hypothetical protein
LDHCIANIKDIEGHIMFFFIHIFSLKRYSSEIDLKENLFKLTFLWPTIVLVFQSYLMGGGIEIKQYLMSVSCITMQKLAGIF